MCLCRRCEWIESFSLRWLRLGVVSSQLESTHREKGTQRNWSRLESSQAVKYLYNATDLMCPFSIFIGFSFYRCAATTSTSMSRHGCQWTRPTDGVFIFSFHFFRFWKTHWCDPTTEWIDDITKYLLYFCEIQNARTCLHAWRWARERASEYSN